MKEGVKEEEGVKGGGGSEWEEEGVKGGGGSEGRRRE